MWLLILSEIHQVPNKKRQSESSVTIEMKANLKLTSIGLFCPFNHWTLGLYS
uniref:Uncharacterized protein n=1 Tax=Tetranychus urticae TaxID=32264 RepID=T1KIE7_TETUR